MLQILLYQLINALIKLNLNHVLWSLDQFAIKLSSFF